MDREQNILRHILEADLIPKNYDDLKEQYIKTVNHLITALGERDEYQGKLHQAKIFAIKDAFDDGYQQGVQNMICQIRDKEWDVVDDGREYVKVKDWSEMRTRNVYWK